MSLHSIYGLKCSIQVQASSSVKPSPPDQQPTYKMAVMWLRTTASVMFTSSLIMSVILAGFHMGFDKALHPHSSFMDGDQQTVSPPRIHSIMILEQTHNYLADQLSFLINVFQTLHIPNERCLKVVHQCIPTQHG